MSLEKSKAFPGDTEPQSEAGSDEGSLEPKSQDETGVETSALEKKEGVADSSKDSERHMDTSEDNGERADPEISESSVEVRDSKTIPSEEVPGAKEQPEKLTQGFTDESTGDAQNSQSEAETSTDSIYRRMFFMRHFHYDDIIIHIKKNVVLIDAKHPEHVDEHGYVSRTFVRKHTLPDHVIADKLITYFTGDGVLVIEAPCSPVDI